MAPRKMTWFRFYVEAFADKKLRRYPPSTRWLFAACMGAARTSPTPPLLLAAEGVVMHASELADYAGLTRKQTTDGIAHLIEVGVLAVDQESGAWTVPAFLERQYESDSSAERTAKWRRCDVEVTRPENREQRTETPSSSDDDVDRVCLAIAKLRMAEQEKAGRPVVAPLRWLPKVADEQRSVFGEDRIREALLDALGDEAFAAALLLNPPKVVRLHCDACVGRGVVELDDGSAIECDCKRRSA